MSHFLHILNLVWEPALAIIAAILAAYVGFRFGRRWKSLYKEALANRAEYHALKAEAQMRAAQSQRVEVHASPTINIGSGTTAAVDAREEITNDHRGSFCTFCGRFGCRSDCREALDGYADVPPLHDEFRAAPAHDLVPRTSARLPRSGDPARLRELGSERPNAGYLASDHMHAEWLDDDDEF